MSFQYRFAINLCLIFYASLLLDKILYCSIIMTNLYFFETLFLKTIAMVLFLKHSFIFGFDYYIQQGGIVKIFLNFYIFIFRLEG